MVLWGYHINEKTCSAHYSSDITHGIVMKHHTCLGPKLNSVIEKQDGQAAILNFRYYILD